MDFLWIFLSVIFNTLGSTAGFSGPLNVAATAGDSVLFTCSTQANTRLRWSTKPIGENPQILTRDNKILPNFEDQYFVEANNSHLNLGIKNASRSNAGRFICLELTTSNTASAELTVIESKCEILLNPHAIQCNTAYKGTLKPEFELKLQTINLDFNDGRLTRRVDLGTDVLGSLNLSCVASFNETIASNANLTPENENGVTGTVAVNAPNSVFVTNCPRLQQPTTSIAGVHRFELFAFAMVSIVYRLSF